MLHVKVIGIGACGNKAAIRLLEKKMVSDEQIRLFNSTLKDIPVEYQNLAVEFGNAKGCGKERGLAKNMMLQALQEDKFHLNSFIDPMDDVVIIATSLEGGTGCGSSQLVAEYIKNVLEKNVHLFAFAGFEDDIRGLQNTVEWFKELSSEYVVETISNKKFLEENGNNRSKAEAAANDEFANRIGILIGKEIDPSSDNMDDTDIYKVATMPGFMTIETCHLTKLKDQEEFNALMQTMIDNSKSLDTEQSAKRIGVVVNCTPKTKAAIDESFKVLIDHYGMPFEIFRHYQNTKEEEFINIIVSGMKLPIDDVNAIYEKYKKRMDLVDRQKDAFFDKEYKMDDGSMFNSAAKRVVTEDQLKAKAASFFSNHGVAAAQPEQPKQKKEQKAGFKNTQISDEL